MRHGGQHGGPTERPQLQGAGKMAEESIVAALQTVFNGAASLSGVLKTVLSKVNLQGAGACLRPCKLTVDLLTLKVVSESRVTWASSVPILVLRGLCVLDLGQMYEIDRRQTCIIA